MKGRIIAIAFISIMVLATLSNTVFAQQSEESYNENIQPVVKSLIGKVDFKISDFNLSEFLEWVLECIRAIISSITFALNFIIYIIFVLKEQIDYWISLFNFLLNHFLDLLFETFAIYLDYLHHFVDGIISIILYLIFNKNSLFSLHSYNPNIGVKV